MLSNIYLTALDERYGRWSQRPSEPYMNAAARRVKDHKRRRTVFYLVRYADDFVVLVDGTREQAEACCSGRLWCVRYVGEHPLF